LKYDSFEFEVSWMLLPFRSGSKNVTASA